MISVKLQFKKSNHINQFIYGFSMLEKAGILKITDISVHEEMRKNLLRAEVDGMKFVYDAEDGDHIERGFFSQDDYHWCDHYFKRSLSQSLANRYPKCAPLGLNYCLRPTRGWLDEMSCKLRRLLGKEDVLHSDFDIEPVAARDPKILFITGLWDPKEFNDADVREEVEKINLTRLSVLKLLKHEFSHCATFGVNGDREFTRKIASEFILPNAKTNRLKFIETMKEHDICLTSTGLHDSTGWRFGEYVATARAIISEPLRYQLPGGFTKGNHYLEFTDDDSLFNAINLMLQNDSARQQMMSANRDYYQCWLRPDKLIFNTLLAASLAAKNTTETAIIAV
ncbi:hypothetical protein GW643_09865 [Serratia marcescens]|uniref:hypothetical protein n=1 Tax=Serratia marcescens TaxID=615 RepID=UPI0013778728|nr:hypothetical protein [Serratia marcescens]NCJ10694.1 hypothetical protein [Serratia marcescens]NDJ00915.1 hypothetical protein [Serratia marcescens]